MAWFNHQNTVCASRVSMSETTLDDVASLIYEASTGFAQWQDALEAVREALDCLVVQIVGVNTRSGRLLFSFESTGSVAEASLDYARTYHNIDPHAAYVASRPSGQLFAFSRVFDQAYVDGSAFYQEFLIPYGSRHMHGAKLHEIDGEATMLGMHRGIGRRPLEGKDWLAAQRLCFHLTKAARIFSLQRNRVQADLIVQGVLDRLRAPVYLIEDNGRVVMKNVAANAMGRNAEPLSMNAEGFLECMHAETYEKIKEALDELGHRVSSYQINLVPRRRVVRIRQTGGGTDQLLCLDAIYPKETMGAFGEKPLLMLTQHQLGKDTHIDPFLIASVLDLTPAEAMVASLVASGHSAKKIAHLRGVSIHTVHTQLKSLVGKLGVHKSTELVAVLHSVVAGT